MDEYVKWKLDIFGSAFWAVASKRASSKARKTHPSGHLPSGPMGVAGFFGKVHYGSSIPILSLPASVNQNVLFAPAIIPSGKLLDVGMR